MTIQPKHTPLSEFSDLFDPEFVTKRKINCIKLLRQITGEGLLETKNFFEQVVQPVIAKSGKRLDNYGTLSHVSVEPSEEPATIPPPMFLVGHSYKQLDGCVVLVLGVSNPNTSYETVYTMGNDGNVIHRYNRRDFGRCTGSDHENPDPRNLEKVT